MNTFAITLNDNKKTYQLTLKAASFSLAMQQLERALALSHDRYNQITIVRSPNK